ncbi:hypothetical protein SRABI96_02719 [Peribacillus sp. Bi96]|nr:hypothetical protein SRABI96_02719 [Peribacillus sp. Bi96]
MNVQDLKNRSLTAYFPNMNDIEKAIGSVVFFMFIVNTEVKFYKQALNIQHINRTRVR